MLKYDFELDLSQNSSTGMILSKIAKDSVVLEFGCAAGRMTRYMKESLNCRVYIVEYDRAAYEIALQYAEDGVCDDIMNFSWMERFRGIQFDAILFADVLEHLTAPEKVLQKAASCLKETGRIYVSLPNITHNDILLKAAEDRFDYTATGLLDNTHVHFWGLKNMEQLAETCNLSLRSIEATYCPTGSTEQYSAADRKRNTWLENILRERVCGEVYQYILTLDRSAEKHTALRLKKPAIHSNIYLDTGNDFNETEKIAVDVPYSDDGSIHIRYTIDDPARIKRLRFDPIEGQACILSQVSICQNGAQLPIICPEGIPLNDGIFFPDKDPFLYTERVAETGPVTLDAKIILAGERFLEMLQHACAQEGREKKDLAAKMEAYQKLAEQKDLYALSLEKEMEQYKKIFVIRWYLFCKRAVRGVKGRVKPIVKKVYHKILRK